MTTATTVTRRINFYSVDVMRLDARGTLVGAEPAQVLTAFRNVHNLIESDPESRYLPMQDGNELFMIVDQTKPVVKGKFAVKRRSMLPPVEQDGEFRPLELDTEEGLAEARHFVYFPDDAIFGLEFNFYAPRVSSLEKYIVQKCAGAADLIRFSPVTTPEALDALKADARVTALELTVYRGRSAFLDELSSDLATAFRSLEKADPQTTKFKIELSVDGRKSEARIGRLAKQLGSFLTTSDSRDVFNGAKARVYQERLGQTTLVDLLETDLVATEAVTVLDLRTKAIVSDEMYKCIEDSWSELR